MQQEDNINPDVHELISAIIKKRGLVSVPEIKYMCGSNVGDGYMSKSFAVSISCEEDEKPLEIFIKSALKVKSLAAIPFDKYYANEIHFYKVIYPTYTKFLAEKNIQNSFRNVPKCYETSMKHVIALENLKKREYILFDRLQIMNDEHILLVLRTLAKFHAVSFAFKDQRKEEYNNLMEGIYNIFECQDVDKINEKKRDAINEFLNSLDPVEDRYILEGCGDLANNLITFFKDSVNMKSEYSVLNQGDCWCNNLLFLYAKDGNKPSDVMLVDWQMIRNALPVYDLSFFLYIISTKEALYKLDHFLIAYHEELSDQIRKLGSDPDKLYPYNALKQHWKEHAKYGFIMALLNIRLMLTEADEAWNFEKIDLESQTELPKIRRYDEYLTRLKILAEHLVRNDFL